MPLTIKQIRKNIYLIEADHQIELTTTFARPQEFYESPYKEIRGKYFTLSEFIDVYSRKGDFTYYTDWVGFNFPGEVLNRFFRLFRRDMSKKELILKKLVQKVYKNKRDKFYIIAAVKNSALTIKHEIAHAYWYLYPEYRRNVEIAIKRIPKKLYNLAKRTLLNMEYDVRFVDDEIQAYLSTDTQSTIKERLGWTAPYIGQESFQNIFNYCNKVFE